MIFNDRVFSEKDFKTLLRTQRLSDQYEYFDDNNPLKMYLETYYIRTKNEKYYRFDGNVGCNFCICS